MMARGQNPVKADWRRLKPTNAVEPEPIGTDGVGQAEREQDDKTGKGQNDALDSHDGNPLFLMKTLGRFRDLKSFRSLFKSRNRNP